MDDTMDFQQLIGMDLHTVYVHNETLTIRRVPGGWIYANYSKKYNHMGDYIGVEFLYALFVPEPK
jgi:hypothetical protein